MAARNQRQEKLSRNFGLLLRPWDRQTCSRQRRSARSQDLASTRWCWDPGIQRNYANRIPRQPHRSLVDYGVDSKELDTSAALVVSQTGCQMKGSAELQPKLDEL